MGASSSSSSISASHGFVAQGLSGRLQPKYEYDMILQQEIESRYIRHVDLSRWSPRQLRGHGHAKCKACFNQWTSYQASAIIDLNKQTIIKVWKQKCRACHNIVEMSFKKDEFRRAVNIMLDRLEQQINGVNSSNFDDTSFGGPPHIKELCEGCDWGSGDCRAGGGGGGVGGGQLQRFGTGNKGSDALRSQGWSRSSTMSVEPWSASKREEDTSLSTGEEIALAGAFAVGAEVLFGGRRSSTREEDTGLSTGQKIAIGGAVAVAVGAAALLGGLAWALSSALEEGDKKGKKK